MSRRRTGRTGSGPTVLFVVAAAALAVRFARLSARMFTRLLARDVPRMWT